MLKKANKKIILGVGALISCIAIVGLCSFFPFIFDPSKWQNSEFLSDELIIAAITIFSVICLMFIAQASNAQNPNSNIARARVRFLGGTTKDGDGKTIRVEGSVERITRHNKISAFSQWVKKVMQPRDIQSAKERMLTKSGINDFSLLELDDSELWNLTKDPQKYGDKFYKRITKKEYKEIERAKRLRVDVVDPSYYLTCSSIDSNKTITEKSGGETRKKATLLSYSIVSKIVIGLIIGMIFASLILDTSTGVEQAKAWMKFVSRMFSMATSSLMGYMIGCQVNDIDADFIEMKCLAHDQFFEDSTFVPKTEQELAKEEFVERVKREGTLLTYEKGKEGKSRD